MAISTCSIVVWTLVFSFTIKVVTCVIQLDFRVTPSIVQPLETKNVTLQCVANEMTEYYGGQQGNDYYNSMEEYVQQQKPPTGDEKSGLVMIRILKNLEGAWQAIAQIGSIAPTVVHQLDKSVSIVDGIISDDLTRPSFIQVTWDVATSDAFGTYRCHAINFDNQQNAILTTSSDLLLGSTLNALDFLRLLKHEMTDIRGELDHQNQDQKSDHDLIKKMKSELQTLEVQTANKQQELEQKVLEQADLFHTQIKKVDKGIADMESEIKDKLGEVGRKVNIVLDSGFLMLWPRGSYGLLQPESGCAFGGITNWESGWVRHHTESTDRNKDELSSETHLQRPTLEREGGNNFLTQHFCIKEASNLGPNWPKGAYCINKKENCPDMFAKGFVKWDEENDALLETSVGSLPGMIFNSTGVTTIEYCCRQDGPADVPVYLPSSGHFYLYRYGGKCQRVHDMNVTEEFVLFDTENTDNRDEFGKVHPDGRINNIRLELCYYQRI